MCESDYGMEMVIEYGFVEFTVNRLDPNNRMGLTLTTNAATKRAAASRVMLDRDARSMLQVR